MANLFLNNSGRLNFLFLINRRSLSSFNNNRTKSGILSLLNNDIDLNIWSEQNWSEFAKQFNKSVEFPFPGQVGVLVASQKPDLSKFSQSKSSLNQQSDSSLAKENLNFLLSTPLPLESQAIKLREACGALYYKQRMENSLFNLDDFSVDAKKNFFEIKAFKCPASLIKDFQSYFRLNSINESTLTVLTISFRSENDMATWNDQVDNERETLIKKFVETAQELCNLFEKEGSWADFIDPSSGRPYKSSYTHATFYETDERYRQLGFEIIDHGCCKVVSHHKFGTKTYVGCLLTTASTESKVVKSLSEKFNLN